MTKLETLEDFLRRKEIKPYDMVNINSLYSENEEVKLPPEITGYNDSQTFCREEDLKFYFAYDKEGDLILYGDTTETKLRLKGEIGALYGISAINLACKPYSNLRKGLYARATTDEDIRNIRTTKEGISMLTEMWKRAWIGSRCVDVDVDIDLPNCAKYYVRYVDYYSVEHNYLFDSYGYDHLDESGVRPIVSIPFLFRIYVDKERSENGKWVLVPER